MPRLCVVMATPSVKSLDVWKRHSDTAVGSLPDLIEETTP